MVEFAKYDCSIAFLLVFGEAYYQEEELKRGWMVDDRTGGRSRKGWYYLLRTVSPHALE